MLIPLGSGTCSSMFADSSVQSRLTVQSFQSNKLLKIIKSEMLASFSNFSLVLHSWLASRWFFCVVWKSTTAFSFEHICVHVFCDGLCFYTFIYYSLWCPLDVWLVVNILGDIEAGIIMYGQFILWDDNWFALSIWLPII